MTSPASDAGDAGGGSPFQSSWDTVRTLPRGFIVAIVIGGGLLTWVLLRAKAKSTFVTTAPENNAGTWENKARTLLLGRGYPAKDVNSALSHYLHGGQMSPHDYTLIAVVIRAQGTPSVPSTAPDYTPAPIVGVNAPSGSSSTTSNPNGNSGSTSANGSGPAWYVVSSGVGWTSTYNGISQQFFGSLGHANEIAQANPTIPVTTNYSRIPLGRRVTVPRGTLA